MGSKQANIEKLLVQIIKERGYVTVLSASKSGYTRIRQLTDTGGMYHGVSVWGSRGYESCWMDAEKQPSTALAVVRAMMEYDREHRRRITAVFDGGFAIPLPRATSARSKTTRRVKPATSRARGVRATRKKRGK